MRLVRMTDSDGIGFGLSSDYVSRMNWRFFDSDREALSPMIRDFSILLKKNKNLCILRGSSTQSDSCCICVEGTEVSPPI